MKARVGRRSSTASTLGEGIWIADRRVFKFPAALPEGPHPIPSRTRKLSPPGPMVLHGGPCGRVGRRRSYFSSEPQAFGLGLLFFWSSLLKRTPEPQHHRRPRVRDAHDGKAVLRLRRLVPGGAGDVIH